MAPTTNTFDAVEMSRRLREETSRQLAALSPAERIALLNSHLTRSSRRDARYETEEAVACLVREEAGKTD